MSPRREQSVLSAQVVLRSATGKRLGGAAAITSETLREYAPAPDAVAASRRAFAELGFDVGPMVGTSFSITAPRDTFERVFGTKLRRTKRGGVERAAKSGGAEMSTDALPKPVRDLVDTVTFGQPPDFGPGSY